MLQRAQWLRSLSQGEREELFELALREVDARFEEWLLIAAGETEDGSR